MKQHEPTGDQELDALRASFDNSKPLSDKALQMLCRLIVQLNTAQAKDVDSGRH